MRRWISAVGILAYLSCTLVAFAGREAGNATLDDRAFIKPDLVVSVMPVPLDKAMMSLSNRAAWSQFVSERHPVPRVSIDEASGKPASIDAAIPLIPGSGVGNRLTVGDLSRALGRPIAKIDADVVTDAVRAFVRKHRGVLGVDPNELGEPRVGQVSEDLWQVYIPQRRGGLHVRDARLVATINHGNLVLFGTERWADVSIGTVPRVSSSSAVDAAFSYIGGRTPRDTIEREPALEIVPRDPSREKSAAASGATTRRGYGHRLVWSFEIERAGEAGHWEFLVDAHTGDVVALRDLDQPSKRRVKGQIYAGGWTNSQDGTPMPWTNTGLASPNDTTNGAGVFEYSGTAASTTLTGRYINVQDVECGSISESSNASGDIDLGGVGGDTSCTSGGSSPGNTPAARTVYSEANRMAEIGRGWLPGNYWTTYQVSAYSNKNNIPCQAYWTTQGTLEFGTGTTCGNSGEMPTVVAHEWGHGLDKNDTNGVLSNSSEAYGDIAALLRQRTSCLGSGYLLDIPSNNQGCDRIGEVGMWNRNESQTGQHHCDLFCSGLRDADYMLHADQQPDTPQNFVCVHCLPGAGPSGRQVHCDATPSRQAAWDFVTRELPTRHGYNAATSFTVANRIFYQGSGNIGDWYSATCNQDPLLTVSNGCGATSAYKQWLATDDDNGNLLDGTPHMTALYNAFNIHNIACPVAQGGPTVQDSGCVGTPAFQPAPTLTATAGCGSVDLGWTAVSGASKYWVFRSEGPSGCSVSGARIAVTTQTSIEDYDVANGFAACYTVAAVGASDSCSGPVASCTCVTASESLPDIGNPLAKVTVPNGGEAWMVNETRTIRWNASDSCASTLTVDILLSRTGAGGSYSAIATGIANSGQYNWLVTGPKTTNAFIKVVAHDTTGHTTADISDYAFVINKLGPG